MSRFCLALGYEGFVISTARHSITRTSQYRINVLEPYVLFASTVFLLILTVVITILYYRRIRAARAKYEEARDVVGDVVVSFNKQLQKHEEQLEKTTYRMEGISAKSESAAVKVEELSKQTSELSSRVAGVASVIDSQNLLTKNLEELKVELNTLKEVQEKFEKHISEAPEVKIEAAIPIKREHALEPLTETELRVLEFIAQEGEKTAPEIKDLTKLTREHSARLVKKLYEEGYLERDTGRAPYKYRVKEEMLKILKKSEARV